MKPRTIGTLALLTLGTVTLAFGQEKENPLSLSLEDCVLRAMKNNLSVAIQVLNPEISVASVSRAQEKFYPSLSFSFNKRNTDAASYSYLDAADSVINKLNDYSVQLNETIPGGGSLGLSLNANKNDSNRSFQTINPRFGSTLTFNFSQPLLKDFGWNISRREILIAQNNLAISENQLEQTLMETIYSVEDAYWNLVYSIDNLEVKRRSLKLAQDLLDKNRRSVEVGQLAPIEVLSAQAEVATREADILQAEAQVKNNEDRLKMILNLSAEEEKAFTSILPKDKPKSQETKMALDEALVTAMENRPELRASRIGLKNQELNVTYAKNQLLPGLNLTASYWSPGVSGEQIIYLNNNPLTGIIIGRVPGGSSAAMKDAFNFKYQNWSVGLTLTLPMNNFLSRAMYTQAKLNMEQSLLNLKSQEQQIFLEIKNAVRAVETNYKRIQAYRVARELADQKLAAEEEKLKVGLSTNYMVLQYQRDLSTARSTELRAIVDYNLSTAALDRALGLSLKNKDMKVADFARAN
jgi:outer membrane protein TolC